MKETRVLVICRTWRVYTDTSKQDAGFAMDLQTASWEPIPHVYVLVEALLLGARFISDVYGHGRGDRGKGQAPILNVCRGASPSDTAPCLGSHVLEKKSPESADLSIRP